MYKVLVWRDRSGICLKFGKDYGCGCWQTIFPIKRPYYIAIPIFKKNKWLFLSQTIIKHNLVNKGN